MKVNASSELKSRLAHAQKTGASSQGTSLPN